LPSAPVVFADVEGDIKDLFGIACVEVVSDDDLAAVYGEIGIGDGLA
jgi:hypothetical protein